MEETIVNCLSCVLDKKQNIEILKKNLLKLNLSETELKRALYQIAGDIINNVDLKTILSNIKENRVLWDHNYYKDIRERMIENDEYLEKPFEVVEGVVMCKKCGSMKTFSYSVQVRSADEGSSTISKCAICNTSWIQHM